MAEWEFLGSEERIMCQGILLIQGTSCLKVIEPLLGGGGGGGVGHRTDPFGEKVRDFLPLEFDMCFDPHAVDAVACNFPFKLMKKLD